MRARLRVGAVDPDTLEVSAFEGLVGSHGGLGGWQDRGLLVGPAHLPAHLLDASSREVQGAPQLHGVLVSMLVRLGQRSHRPRPAGTAHQ